MNTLTFLLLAFLTIQSYSQNDTTLVFALPELKIRQSEKNKTVIYEFDNSLNKFTLTSSFLQPDTNKYKNKVSLGDIQNVYIRSGSKFWQGAIAGGTVGFLLGFVFGGFIDLHNRPTFHVDQGIVLGIVTAIPIALIGGVIGALIPNYDEYYFGHFQIDQKYQFLKRTFNKYQQVR